MEDGTAFDRLGERLAADWPLIGRQRIRTALRGLAGRPSTGVALVGPAGVGKSALAAEAIARARAAREHVVFVQGCERQTGTPYYLASAFLPGRGELPTTAAVIGAVLHDLRDHAGGRDILVAIDDAHLLDEASVGLLQHLVAVLDVSVLMTVRTTVGGDSPAASLVSRGAVERIDVGGLGRDDFAELLASVLEGPMDGRGEERLWRRTQGNPLALRHLLREGMARGSLSRDAGRWFWSDDDGTPTAVSESVRSTLAGLSESESRCLALVSLSQPIAVDLLEHCLGPHATTTVESLERRGLVVVVAPPSGSRVEVSAAHPTYAEQSRAGLTDADLRTSYALLVRATEAAESVGAPVVDPLELVAWRVASGERLDEPEARRAARRALAEGRPDLAETLMRRYAGPAAPELAQALVVQGRAAEAEDAFRAAAIGDADGSVRAVRALNLLWGLGDVETARHVVGTAPSRPETAIAARALELFGPSADRRAGDGVAEITGNRFDDPIVAACARLLRAYALVFGGRPSALVAEVEAGRIDISHGWSVIRGSTEACHAHALGLTGRLGTAHETIRRYYARAVTRDDRDAIRALALESAVVEMWRGDFESACSLLVEAAWRIDDQTLVPMRAYIASEYAACAAAMGRWQQGAKTLADAREDLPGADVLRDHLAWGQARVDVHAGVPGAGESLSALAERQAVDGRYSDVVESLYLLARTQPTPAVVARLRDAVECTDSPLFGHYLDHARALVSADPRALAAVSETFEAAGYRALAFEAGASAHAALDEGCDLRFAARLSRRVSRLRSQCRGLQLRWVPAVPEPPALTVREDEVCRSAARGLDNASIARELGVSVRTVANHLQNAYAKLGVEGRGELRDLLPELEDGGGPR